MLVSDYATVGFLALDRLFCAIETKSVAQSGTDAVCSASLRDLAHNALIGIDDTLYLIFKYYGASGNMPTYGVQGGIGRRGCAPLLSVPTGLQ
jgi:hypothetical protein